MFTHKVTFSDFKKIVDEELSSFLKHYGFERSFADVVRGYIASYFCGDLALLISWDFQVSNLECDVVHLKPGNQTPEDRFRALAIKSWTPLEQMTNSNSLLPLPPDIGLFPNEDDLRRGLRTWREVLETSGRKILEAEMPDRRE